MYAYTSLDLTDQTIEVYVTAGSLLPATADRCTEIRLDTDMAHWTIELTSAQLEQLYHEVTARRSKIAQRQAIAAEAAK